MAGAVLISLGAEVHGVGNGRVNMQKKRGYVHVYSRGWGKREKVVLRTVHWGGWRRAGVVNILCLFNTLEAALNLVPRMRSHKAVPIKNSHGLRLKKSENNYVLDVAGVVITDRKSCSHNDY